jgi:predicted nucleotidyltransferase
VGNFGAPLTKVYLFGSSLIGTAKAESDLDITVEIIKGAGDTSYMLAKLKHRKCMVILRMCQRSFTNSK